MAENKTKTSKKTVEELNELYGKMPPQAVDIEEVLLGALMLEQDAILLVIDILEKESFYKEEHKIIFEAIMELAKEQKPIDILTVTNYLKAINKIDEVGGPHYISELTSRVATAAHVEYHAKIIQQKYIQRMLIQSSSEIQKRAFDDSQDVDNLINYAENEIFQISEGNIKKETVVIKNLVGNAISLVEEASQREDGLSGVPSGFSELDRYTSGWQPADLVIVAARPAMGKTAFALSMLRNVAIDHDKPVALFSLEMSSLQLVTRLISGETEIPGNNLRNGNLQPHEWEQLDAKVKPLEQAPVYVDDTPAISVFELRAKARRLVKTHHIKLILVDYLQLMTANVDTKGNRQEEVSIISRNLKAIAKELNVPIIALSQLNRSVETRGGDKRPQLSDLRESGAIEQDADMVLFLHRPEYYDILEDKEGNSLKGMAEVILAKHRNGATGSIYLEFVSEFAKFKEKQSMLDPSGMTLSSKMNEEQGAEITENDAFGNIDDEDENPISF
ncbi:MAG: replicative DNA helicase [Bacteroidota bacterium]|nr:replicative DNA helicase [Bacteroidota bacterium]